MANTDKQNFRCDTATKWVPFKAKIQALDEAGYEVDMSAVLRAEVDRIIAETPEKTIRRLRLKKKAS